MYKKFICIAFFLVMLVSMTCVSASEEISADSDSLAKVNEIEVQTAQDDMNNDLSIDYNNDVISDDVKTGDLDPNLDAHIETDDEYITIRSTVNEDATGNISIEVINLNDKNSTPYTDTVDIENGKATWAEMVSFNKGDYVVDIIYWGDANYHPASLYKVFEISKYIPDFNVNITTDDQYVTVTATANKDATGNVTIRIKKFEDENYTEYATLELENGTATWAEPVEFNKGDYVLYTTYSGDGKYFKSGNIQTFTIEKEISNLDVNITVNDYLITLNATLPENATGKVNIKIRNINEENYTDFGTLKLENGTAVWSDFVPFNKGEYIACVAYGGDKNYFKTESTQTFTIEKQIPEMFIYTATDGANFTITVTLPENATGVVTFTDNQTGEMTNVTLNGTSVTYNATLQDIYGIFIVRYSGDDDYFGVGTIVVGSPKMETSLSTPDSVSVTYKNTAKITVKLDILNALGNVTSDGEKITITVNKKTYTGTLKNGTVTINIAASYADKFVPNNYTANVTFQGSDLLKNSSTSFVLVVKKGTPKLTAKDKTFKVSTKTKKYTITLKNNKNEIMKNAKVTIKVNGKTFKATTNSKGQATFKITNLKKRARYAAVVKYAGSSYYTTINKKIKITVK